MIRDGVIVRTHMTAMDHCTVGISRQRLTDAAQYWRDNRNRFVVHDGTGRDPGLHQPGWRMLDNDFRQTGKQAAYDAYERDLVSAYKNPLGMGSMPNVETNFGSQGPPWFSR
jgi:hypothetical protein